MQNQPKSFLRFSIWCLLIFMFFIFRALYWNLVGLIFILLISLGVGLVIYTKYYDCDPLLAKRIEISEQVKHNYTLMLILFSKLIIFQNKLYPLFVMETLNKTTGLPGLFLACLFSAALRYLIFDNNKIDVFINVFNRKLYRNKTHNNFSNNVFMQQSETLFITIRITNTLIHAYISI